MTELEQLEAEFDQVSMLIIDAEVDCNRALERLAARETELDGIATTMRRLKLCLGS